jgi:glutamine cyclotransferase
LLLGRVDEAEGASATLDLRDGPARLAAIAAVTGVTWVDGELCHGTWEGDDADIRRVDPQTGEVLDRLIMPDGKKEVSGLESDQGDLLYAGGGGSGRIRAARRPGRRSAR